MSLPVTVVVCTRNPGSRIRSTVASVLGDESGVSLVLVDQSDDEDVVRVLGEWASHPRFVRVPCSGRGLALARNVGVRATSTPIVAFTDDDCVATPGWATEIAHPFAEHDRIALVFGTVKPAPFDPALGFLPSYSRATPVLATSIFDKHLVEGIGASMAVRRTAWEHLHGFDEALGAGSAMHSAEETDFVMRALLAGYFVSETTGATVVHAGFRTLAMAPMVLGGYLFGIGASLAKLARLGHWQVLAVAARLALRWTVARPVVDMGRTSHRRARLFGFLKGVATGLVTPVDRRTGHFCPRPADATPAATSRGSLDDVPRSVAIEAIIADRSPATLPAGTSAPTSERVSIVLPNWNGRAFLARALESLVARTSHPYELIVVDNGSTDGSPAFIRDFFLAHPEVDARLIANPVNRYFSTACNQGFQAASPDSKYLALYCNDVEATSDTWLQDLVLAIQRDDTIAAGQAMIKPITDRYRGVFASYDPVYADPQTSRRMIALLREPGAMHLEGHCFLLKRALVQHTGLYLHTGPFEQYHSDWELYVRFAAFGYRIAPVDLKVHHWHSVSELIAFHPELYDHLVGRLDDPDYVARSLAEGRPMYEAESGFRGKYPTRRARLIARLRGRIGKA